MATVQDIVNAVGASAPWGQAADWDSVGLQVGDASAEATGVLVALDATPAVVDEAVARGANVLLTHHPLLFKPPKRVTAGDPVGGLVLRLAQAGVALVSAHTNLDASALGVSVALARRLGLENVRVLSPISDAMRLVVTYVPQESAAAVREALAAAGAGQIGAYDACSYSSDGTGRFTAGAGARPAVGAVGAPEVVAEVRLEAAVPCWLLPSAITAIIDSHPYEAPVVLAHPVAGVDPREGFGAIGDLPDEERLVAFLARVAGALGTSALRHVGDPDRPVRRVAVCGGSGMSFLPGALRASADAYVTADVTYHRWFEALGPDGEPQIALVDAGHYETEAVAEALLVDVIAEALPDLPCHRTRLTTNPMQVFVAPR